MSSRDWRSESAYEELNTASLRDLAWEYLRRNPDYVCDHARSIAAQSDEAAAVAVQTWGLRFRRRSQPARKSRRGFLVGAISAGDRDDRDAGSAEETRRQPPTLAAAAS